MLSVNGQEIKKGWVNNRNASQYESRSSHTHSVGSTGLAVVFGITETTIFYLTQQSPKPGISMIRGNLYTSQAIQIFFCFNVTKYMR